MGANKGRKRVRFTVQQDKAEDNKATARVGASNRYREVMRDTSDDKKKTRSEENNVDKLRRRSSVDAKTR